MSLEKSLWAWLKRAREFFGAALEMTRVENGVSGGIPDVEGCLKVPNETWGRQLWIELKVAKRPAKPETPVRFKVRPKQVEWNEARWRVGGRAFFLLQVGSAEERALYLVPGCYAAGLKSGMTESQLNDVAVNGFTKGREVTAAYIIQHATGVR